jgi:short-subunit dehydrogenase
VPLLAPLNPPLPPWPQARVWIVGASTGIGAATAQALLAAGARVAVSARSKDKLEALVADAPQRALVEALDFTDANATRAAWTRVFRAWDGIDLVLVVAGTHDEMRAWDLTPGKARALLETNLHAPIDVVATILPDLLAQGHGAIGVVASLAGYRGLPRAIVYGASKAGLINFTETLYFDLRPRGIGVYLINPGFVRTPLTDRNTFRMPHLMQADDAARAMLDGLRRGDFEIDFPKAFSRQLKLMRWLPYRAYFAIVRRATGL